MTVEERRVIEALQAHTGGLIVTEQDVSNAEHKFQETLEILPPRSPLRPAMLAAAAVIALILGIVAFQTLGGSGDSTGPVNQPTNLTDDVEAFLSGSDPTEDLLEGTWHFDNSMVSYTTGGEIRMDDGGLLLTNPAVIGTYTIAGDLITVDVSGGRAGCAGEQLALRASVPAPGEVHSVLTQAGVNACTWVLNELVTMNRVLPSGGSYLAGLEVSEEDLAAMQRPDGASRLYGDWIAQDGPYLLELSAGGGYYVAGELGDVVDRGEWSLTEHGSQLRLVSRGASPTCKDGDRLVLGDLAYVRTTDVSAFTGTTQRNDCDAPWTPEFWISLPSRG